LIGAVNISCLLHPGLSSTTAKLSWVFPAFTGALTPLRPSTGSGLVSDSLGQGASQRAYEIKKRYLWGEMSLTLLIDMICKDYGLNIVGSYLILQINGFELLQENISLVTFGICICCHKNMVADFVRPICLQGIVKLRQRSTTLREKKSFTTVID
jgi:hypothetical protein